MAGLFDCRPAVFFDKSVVSTYDIATFADIGFVSQQRWDVIRMTKERKNSAGVEVGIKRIGRN